MDSCSVMTRHIIVLKIIRILVWFRSIIWTCLLYIVSVRTGLYITISRAQRGKNRQGKGKTSQSWNCLHWNYFFIIPVSVFMSCYQWLTDQLFWISINRKLPFCLVNTAWRLEVESPAAGGEFRRHVANNAQIGRKERIASPRPPNDQEVRETNCRNT